MKLATMVISLVNARAAALREDWRQILGLGSGAGLLDVQNARRALMRGNHPDKGGNTELCQLINLAADKLEEKLDAKRAKQRSDQDAEEERQAREEERRAWLAREDERLRREAEERLRRARQERTEATWMMVETVHQRTRNKITLGEYAGRAFPVAKRRLSHLHCKRKNCRARVLTYAIEAEIAARRANRADKWPKTAGLDKRCPDLAAELVILKKAYDKAYQNLRYLRGKGKLHAHALLATRRLMREAWMLYLAMPAPMSDEVVRHA